MIAQRAFSSVENWVEASHIGELKLKGFNAPIAAYEVVSWRGETPVADPPEIAPSEVGAPDKG